MVSINETAKLRKKICCVNKILEQFEKLLRYWESWKNMSHKEEQEPAAVTND
jgi:hypothetical protein